MKKKRFLRHRRTSRRTRAYSSQWRRVISIIILTIALAFFGLMMILNASSVSALRDFNDPYHYVRDQAMWILLGVGCMTVFSFIDYRSLYRLAIPLLIGGIILLLAVFIPGIGVHALGASRWIDFGIATVQPAELVKVAIIVYLAAWFSRKEKGRLTSFLFLMGIVVGLILMQPNLGTAGIIIGVALAMYFLSGPPLWQFAMLIPAVFSALVVLAISSPYRLERVKTFFNPQIDPQGASYHVRQILIALGSGGWFGTGLGKSRQKFTYLPEVTTDSIFAIISEELGFIGASALILLLAFLVIKSFRIAANAPDMFGSMLASGITIALSVQILVNLASMVALVPLTGTPLPFISYGGSNLLVSFTMVGILVSIARQSK